MSKFAQYYCKYKYAAGCYDWQLRQQHLDALFNNNESIEFCLGEDADRKLYKHKVYHLSTAPGITVMRFANNIDIPVERDFEPAMAKDEPSCFVIIDNRNNMRTVAIQKRRKAFSDTHKVAKILSQVIDKRLFLDHCYGFEILPDYYPADLFTIWELQQAHTQQMRFGTPEMEKEDILAKVEALKAKKRDYFDDSIMGQILDVCYAQKKAKYKGHYTVMPEDRKAALYVDKNSVFMRNMLTFAEAVDEPVELITTDGITFRCFIDNDGDNTDKIVSHEFDENHLEILLKLRKKDGSKVEPEDRLKAEEAVLGLMNSMKHEVEAIDEEQAA